jgi:hypothetical protein
MLMVEEHMYTGHIRRETQLISSQWHQTLTYPDLRVLPSLVGGACGTTKMSGQNNYDYQNESPWLYSSRGAYLSRPWLCLLTPLPQYSESTKCSTS